MSFLAQRSTRPLPHPPSLLDGDGEGDILPAPWVAKLSDVFKHVHQPAGGARGRAARRPAASNRDGRTANQSDRMPCRASPGNSLIEVLVAITIVSVILTAAAVSIGAIYRVDRHLKDNAAYAQMVPRLALRLRTDVHAASKVAIQDATDDTAGAVLTLAETGEVIEYQSNAGRLIRTRRRDQEDLGREVFSLGKATTLHWRTSDSPSRMLELEIVRATGKIDAPDARQVDRITAAISLHHPTVQEGANNASNE